MFNYRDNKLGMTLVEMVISLVILGILMTSTMGIIISSNNIFISTSTSALDKQVGNSVYDLMEKAIKYTTHLQIVDQDNNKMGQAFSIQVTDEETNSGIIRYRRDDTETNLYNGSFYGNRTVQYAVDPYGSDGKHVKLTVNVFRNGKRVYQRSAIIRCVNLALIGGSNGNGLVKTSTSEFNQIISFSTDEELWAGGDSAWSVEYKAANYIAKYNRILNEYYTKLQPICADYKTTINKYDNTVQNRIFLDDLTEATRKYEDQIFGGSTHINYTPGMNMSNVYGTEDQKVNGEYKNLRAYYQKQIFDLLNFSPTAAFPSSASPVVNKHYAKNNNDNPYYGVVATKEELWAGFMLTYYSKDDENQVVTKDDYPSFENAKDFFGSSTLANYATPSSSNGQDKMVILGYFMDNTDEKYGVATKIASDSTESKLLNTQSKTVEYYNTTSAAYGNDNWAVSSQFVFKKGNDVQADLSKANVVSAADIPADKAINFGGKSVDHFTLRISNSVTDYHTLSQDITWYGYYTNDGRTISSSGTIGTASAGYVSNAVALAYNRLSSDAKTKYNSAGTVLTSLGVTNILDYANKTNEVSNGGYTTTGVAHTGDVNWRYFTATKDIPEGWYYYKDEGSYEYAYYCFYLKANESKNEEDKSLNEKNIAIANGSTVHLFSKGWDLKYVAYNQAEYIMGKTKAGEETIDFYEPTYAHQYTDWCLYGVDWNSWFAPTQKTGLLNKAVLTIRNFVVGIFDKSSVISDLTGVTTEINGDGMRVSKDAVTSLGVQGTATVGSTNSDLRSYNAAYMVYHNDRGTWYYLPQNSTLLSTWASGKTGISNKDCPILLDVEYRTGNQWASSKAMQSDINNRKLSSSALWGVVDTTSDVNWNALPADNAGVDNAKITITDTTLNPSFNTNTSDYSATTTAAKSTITASYVTNDYDSNDISIEITVNNKTVTNSSSVTWRDGANNVVVKVIHTKVTYQGMNKKETKTTLKQYNITVTKTTE